MFSIKKQNCVHVCLCGTKSQKLLQTPALSGNRRQFASNDNLLKLIARGENVNLTQRGKEA